MAEPRERPQWAIDRALETLRGQQVRVGAESFAPILEAERTPMRFIPACKLILPDNSRAEGLQVFFEGRLEQFERQIGVVQVRLGPPDFPRATPDGIVHFRGRTAVILRGPAIVTLAFPFHIEKLPPANKNYWVDLRMPLAQFFFPFDD